MTSESIKTRWKAAVSTKNSIRTPCKLGSLRNVTFLFGLVLPVLLKSHSLSVLVVIKYFFPFLIFFSLRSQSSEMIKD